MSKKNEKIRIYVFSNGNIAAFNENDEQVSELQEKSINDFICERAEKLGYNPLNFTIKYPGNEIVGKPFKTPNGWNHEIEYRT